jgi:hypothetical protein
VDTPRHWPALEKDDKELLKEIQDLLSTRTLGDPYGADGTFASNIRLLPPGLRAMAATHWLDVSLTLDSITWHFGNFGEPALVAETEAGLRELRLHELADCFVEAKELMMLLLRDGAEKDGNSYDVLERAELRERADEIDRRAWELDGAGPEKSVIYNAWVQYTREHPERVFVTELS